MVTDETQQEAPENIPAPPPKKAPSKGHSFLPLLALIVALIAVVLSLRTIQQNKIKIEAQSTLSKNIDDLYKQQKNVQSTLSSTIKNNEETQQSLTAQINQINKSFHAFKQQTHYGNEEWLLLKARYYLELAEIQNHWGNNLDITIALLQQANAVLSEANNVKLFDIRQAITKEIALLETTPKLDLVGLLSRLDAEQTAVDNLNLRAFISMPTESTQKKTADSTWRSNWENSLHVLEKMVVIRHHDQDIKPLFSSQQIALIRERIRNNLQEAEWGLLQQNQPLYQFALAKTIANVNRSFDTQAETTVRFIRELKSLKTIQFTQPKLNLEESLNRLNQLINAKKPEKSP